MKDNSQFGKMVYVHYKGGAQGESPVDDRSEGEPVKIILGAGQVVPGIEDALCEMAVGEERTVTVTPDQGYGRHDPDGVQRYPRGMLPGGPTLKTGDVLAWTNPASGEQIPVRVIDEALDTVVVDFNHPFAGKTLEYWLRVERVVG